METSDGFGLRGGGGWGALPSWPNPEGGVLRCPVIAARSARSLDAAAPRPPRTTTFWHRALPCPGQPVAVRFAEIKI